MARLHLTIGTRYAADGRTYTIRQTLSPERLLVEDEAGAHTILSRDDIRAAWGRGDLTFILPARPARDERPTVAAPGGLVADFDGLPAAQRAKAWRRYELIAPLLALPPSARTRRMIDDHMASSLRSPSGPTDTDPTASSVRASSSSIKRYLRAYEEGGCDIRALVPAVRRRGGRGQGRLDDALEGIVRDALAECAASPGYRTVRDVYYLIVTRVRDENVRRATDAPLALAPLAPLPLPSRATVHRRVRAAAAAILRRRPSAGEAQAAASVQPGPRPTRILERVEIDHTTLDLILVDEEDRLPIGRPTLTLALDVHSGFPTGVYVGFEPPGYGAAMRCLLHAILPKDDAMARYGTAHPWPVYGLPETLVVDNARHLIGRDLRDACGQLGIALDPAPVRRPWFKGAVERQFRTHNTGLVHTLPGTTFSNVLQRGDYDAAGHACISLTRFGEILHLYLLDLYAQQWHTGVGGTPAALWERGRAAGVEPALPRDAAEVRILLGRSATRTIQRTGIDFSCLRYQSAEAGALRQRLPLGAPVRVKYDPEDLGALHVLDQTDAAGEGRWLRVPAVDQAYARGLSLWKHRIIHDYARRAMRREIDIYALAEAKERIRRIVEDEFQRTRRGKGRRTLARAREVGGPPDQPCPPPPLGPLGSPLLLTARPVAVAASDANDDVVLSDTRPGWGGDYNLPRA